MSRHAELAILYPRASLPARWIEVGRWTISNNVVDAGDTVLFYATNGETAPTLISALRRFSSQLPTSVHQQGRHLAP